MFSNNAYQIKRTHITNFNTFSKAFTNLPLYYCHCTIATYYYWYMCVYRNIGLIYLWIDQDFKIHRAYIFWHYNIGFAMNGPIACNAFNFMLMLIQRYPIYTFSRAFSNRSNIYVELKKTFATYSIFIYLYTYNTNIDNIVCVRQTFSLIPLANDIFKRI